MSDAIEKIEISGGSLFADENKRTRNPAAPTIAIISIAAINYAEMPLEVIDLNIPVTFNRQNIVIYKLISSRAAKNSQKSPKPRFSICICSVAVVGMSQRVYKKTDQRNTRNVTEEYLNFIVHQKTISPKSKPEIIIGIELPLY